MQICMFPTCDVTDKGPFVMVVSASSAVRGQRGSRSEGGRLLGSSEPDHSCPAHRGSHCQALAAPLHKQQGKDFGSLITAVKYLDGLSRPYYPSVPMVESPDALPLAVSSPLSK